MNDDRATSGVASDAYGAAVYEWMEAALLAPGEGARAALSRDYRDAYRSRFSLTENAKRRIEIDARKCAREGVTRRDGCRWAFGTAEGQHWTAVFLLAGGVL